MAKIHELRPSPADTEKITINLGYVDLGHIDLMVRDGFYSNRTDFIRTAIRNQLDRHDAVLKKSVEDNNWISDCTATVARTSRPSRRPRRPFISRCSGWPSSREMSLPNWLATRSPQFTCSGP
jgi:Arc/MetJ-type ribon-helix-helix transcriptional regulator